MARDYESGFTVFDATSSSSYTSAIFRGGRFTRMCASLVTDDTGASRFTLQGCNEPSATSFGTVAVLLAAGYADVSVNSTPPLYFRWQRSSLESTARLWVFGKTP